MTTHLTITGMYAGAPLCDVNKVEAKLAGDQFVHAMYAPIDKLTDLCEKCKAEWEAAAEDDDDDKLAKAFDALCSVLAEVQADAD